MIDVATVRLHLAKGERTRQYIGASGIGNDCAAYQHLSLRGFPSDVPKPQMLRIFGEGHRIEELVVNALSEAGHEVEELDPKTGEQWEYVSHGGHHVCHLDGYITLLGSADRMTLEIKSMNRKMFDKFKTVGVKLSHHDYWLQCQDGLALASINGVSVNKCFFVAYCKDNSMYHAEIIEFDKNAGNKLWEGLNMLTNTSTIIRRKGGYEQEYDCTQCFKKTACWKPADYQPSCAKCSYASPNTHMGGKTWDCGLKAISNTQQPCEHFKLWRPEKKR